MSMGGSSGVQEEAEQLVVTFGRFMATLGAVVRSAVEWLALVVADVASSGGETVSEQAGDLAGATKSTARTFRKKVRNGVLKLALVGVFLWWLDRELSGSQ